jgi:hypothetical protein
MTYKVTIYYAEDGANYQRLWEPSAEMQKRFNFHILDQEQPFPNTTEDSLVHGLLESWTQTAGFGPVGELEMEHGLISRVRLERVPAPWDETHPQDAPCAHCTHPYFRHYDGYEDNAAVGCKYCGCFEFIEQGEVAVETERYYADGDDSFRHEDDFGR